MHSIKKAVSLTALLVVLAACASQEPKAAPSPKPGTIAVVLGKEIPKKDAEKLDGIIFGALREKFVKDNKIEATPAEVDAFVAKFNELSESAPIPLPTGEVPEAQMRAIERDLAQGMVTTWKVNKAFYDQYGGRVIFQQFGPEPVDAYRDFLKEQEREGAFEILDPQYEVEFWDYFVNDSSHSFLSAEKGKEAMTTPWWLMETPDR
jgi:hypothetical protein